MIEAIFHAKGRIEKFSTWLLIGSASVASILVSNADKLIPIIGRAGFLTCGILLSLSCLFGLLSKIFGVRFDVAQATSKVVKKAIDEHVSTHAKVEHQIDRAREQFGLSDVDAGIRWNVVLDDFFGLMPPWVRWGSMRFLRKHKDSPFLEQLPLLRSAIAAGLSAVIQAFLFLMFLVAGFIFPASVPAEAATTQTPAVVVAPAAPGTPAALRDQPAPTPEKSERAVPLPTR